AGRRRRSGRFRHGSGRPGQAEARPGRAAKRRSSTAGATLPHPDPAEEEAALTAPAVPTHGPTLEHPVTDTPVTDSMVDGDAEETDRPERGEALLVREGDIAGDYLERLLDIVDFDGDIDLDVEGDRAVVAVIGDG